MLLGAAVVAVSVAYVIAVNPGLPYDEPAHWANILYITHHGTPPVLGRNASYEAQMGPVAYYLYAAVTRTATARHAGTSTAFYACRLLGIPLLLTVFVLTRRLVTGYLSSTGGPSCPHSPRTAPPVAQPPGAITISPRLEAAAAIRSS